MDPTFYKKTGLMTTILSRDLLVRDVGDQIPTIASCVETYKVSRGTVQDAFSILEKDGGLVVGRHGKNGSIIEQLDKSKLIAYANLDPLCASMPVPLSEPLGSLATAVCRCMSEAPVSFTFAFIEGATNRVEALQRMTYDFIVVSLMSAKVFTKQHPELEIAMILHDCIYCNDYVLCVPNQKTLQPGMVIGCDTKSNDQFRLTQQVAEKYHLTIKPIPYMACISALLEHQIDATVYRKESWLIDSPSISISPIQDMEYNAVDMNTPVILTNRNNHGIAKILCSYLKEKELYQIQQLVLNHKMHFQFF